MFHNPKNFTFTTSLEQNWSTIRAEFDHVREHLVDWYETDLYGSGWKVYRICDFPHGQIIADNAARCPVTTRIVAEQFGRHGAVGFSVLLPGTRIRPHQGFAGEFLRCHLGLYVPEGDCALRVGDETKYWQAGRVTVFDDRVMHEAWNLTDQERVVLLIDFIPKV